MDILDVILAQAMTPQGQIDTYAARAAKAVQDANTAVAAAENAVDNIDSITEQTNTNNTLAAATLEQAQAIIEELDGVADEVTGLFNDFTFQADPLETISMGKQQNVTITYPDAHTTTITTAKYYNALVDASDGAITPNAVNNALMELVQNLMEYIDTHTPSGGGSSTVDAPAGTLITVNSEKNLTASNITEDDIAYLQMLLGVYRGTDTYGVIVDYANHTCVSVNPDANLNRVKFFGGRRRCVVDNNGSIVAWYGDSGYVEDGSRGQVMVYQPKFYYTRVPMSMSNGVIQKENIILSVAKRSGFEIHPLFLDENGNELEYVLLSAYEGSLYDTSAAAYIKDDSQVADFNADYLSSIAAAKPISGSSQDLTLANAEKLAANRGTGWSLTDLTSESAQQMLMLVEYLSPNLQNALNSGISTLDFGSGNGSCLTGSTSDLGNTSGRAARTTQTIGSTSTDHTTDGACAVSYRGVENPYGNIWRMVGGSSIQGTSQTGNKVYFHDTPINIIMPTSSNWIVGFGYDDANPWAFVPAAAGTGANSVYPVGDYIYGASGASVNNLLCMGGIANGADMNGPFAVAGDRPIADHRARASARIMYKPTYSSSIYQASIASWKTQVGSDIDD